MFLCFIPENIEPHCEVLNLILNRVSRSGIVLLMRCGGWRLGRRLAHFSSFDAGASINTPNMGNSALIIEELDWGGQDALNTCENSFFGPHLGLGRQKTWSDLDKTLDVEPPY